MSIYSQKFDVYFDGAKIAEYTHVLPRGMLRRGSMLRLDKEDGRHRLFQIESVQWPRFDCDGTLTVRPLGPVSGYGLNERHIR